ncbi:MAG: class I SAM-dependent methyltransferase [Gemmataceae bacterium]|nr:class I SAM-dependent methyltransferase [Gemmataceae bacterium]
MPQVEMQSEIPLFFEDRASHISDNPDWRELCWVSGREPRLWMRPEMYQGLMRSVQQQLELTTDHSLLEVGCAAGMLAKGFAPLCKQYVGLDIAPGAVAKARTLGLPNATFEVANAQQMVYPDGAFDRAVCYDVLTNFDSFAKVEPILREMVRMVKPGGKALVGSIPDESCKEAFLKRAGEVSKELDAKFGPLPPPPQKHRGPWKRLASFFKKEPPASTPEIVCYYFRKEDFLRLGQELNVHVEIGAVHDENPYAAYRFNVIYSQIR